jgi:uncharacterized membrane protein YedE/YeeE
MLELIQQPWHWAFSGAMIALIMFIMLFFGKKFGLSSTLNTICSIGGAGKKISYFDFDWKTHTWNLYFVLGAIIGGYIASHYLMGPETLAISAETIEHVGKMGVQYPSSTADGMGFLPSDLFNVQVLLSVKGLILFVGGGFLVGFGARYAGGCTSGHAITGLSNFQMPSLISVIGFFIGGLLMTHFILPLILTL